jgi:CBS domain-containing protein
MDVMATKVISVGPLATIKETATLLVQHGISGLPVLDANQRLVGMVSEGDLIRRPEIGTQPSRRSWWLELFSSNRTLAESYIKHHGQTVQDVMTPEVTTVSEMTQLSEIAALLESKRIKRVPVLRDGRVVGIVSRANLVQALASAALEPDLDITLTDQEIRQKILAETEGQDWARAIGANIVVRDGIVHLWGYVRTPEESQAMRVAAENVPGVKSVEDHTEAIPVVPGL